MSQNSQEATQLFLPVRACIFDVDGLLIDSEDIYTDIFNKILHSHGRPPLTWVTKALQQSRGQIGDKRVLSTAALEFLSVSDYRAQVAAHYPLFRNSKPLPGVLTILSNLASAFPPVSLAIASSTSTALFETKMAHLPHLKAQFSRRCTLLADDEDMKQKKGKPAGDVFLLAMERMNVALLESAKDSEEGGSRLLKPEECLVFEDSIAGVKAGRAAGMRVCWVPHVGLRKVCVGLEKMVLAGNMEEVETRLLEREGTSMDLDATGSVEGEGEVEKIESEDGWAEMIGSLEDFDYARYGIQLKE